MLSRLRYRFGISGTGTALKMFESYVGNRTQNIQVHDTIFEEQTVAFGVPQGSVLGPLLFILYITPLCDSPGILSPKVGQPHANCNKSQLNGYSFLNMF